MRFVKKEFDKPPEKLQKCAARYRDKLLTEKKKHRFKKSCYNAAAKKELLGLYFGKCAYCETKIEVGFYSCIDHYRPKSIYYWLAYEWSNLLPTCFKCNTLKSNRFDIEGERVVFSEDAFLADSHALLNERPLLIHPEINNPEDFLCFDRDGGIIAKSNHSKGKYTVDILNLNRDKLKKDRKEQVMKISRMINNQSLKLLEFFGNQIKDKERFEDYKELISLTYYSTFMELVKLQDPEELDTYTLLGKYMYEDFNFFITSRLKKEKIRLLINKAFQLFKKDVLLLGGDR